MSCKSQSGTPNLSPRWGCTILPNITGAHATAYDLLPLQGFPMPLGALQSHVPSKQSCPCNPLIADNTNEIPARWPE
ncbi:MAG: hypothetical protein IKH64_02760 [Prevotella sp.]|nr:hypothetical protein [Prevotella sp.]